MTDQNAPAPGWYPDPQGSGALRWWDGAHWTEHAAPVPAPAPAFAPAAAGPSPYGAPYAPARRRPLPADTPIYTPWIWLVAALPLVSTLLLFLLHPQPVFASTSGSPSRVVVTDPMALLGGPVYFLVIGIGWLITAACIVFSWLDYRELVRRGVERPFHWAWSFLGIVYPDRPQRRGARSRRRPRPRPDVGRDRRDRCELRHRAGLVDHARRADPGHALHPGPPWRLRTRCQDGPASSVMMVVVRPLAVALETSHSQA
ncbi:DUF2510 domain-containing protein [Leifsonia sp. L25]|uniref:DUF2510 domain-containing protein n=1 Tax=Leifsonia sp. L25 TaxID=3423957 RepID=UPI003D692357